MFCESSVAPSKVFCDCSEGVFCECYVVVLWVFRAPLKSVLRLESLTRGYSTLHLRIDPAHPGAGRVGTTDVVRRGSRVYKER